MGVPAALASLTGFTPARLNCCIRGVRFLKAAVRMFRNLLIRQTPPAAPTPRSLVDRTTVSDLVRQARAEDLKHFHQHAVYKKVPVE